MKKYEPRFMHHVIKPPVMVYSQEQEDALGPEWSRMYIHQAYPKVKYHWTKRPTTVKNADEEAALGGGWAESPAVFESYKAPSRARPGQNDPTKWVNEWSVCGLTEIHRKKIKAQLMRADGAFWRSPDLPTADVDSMGLAFNGIAQVLFDAGILTRQLLAQEIPTLVWDSAIAGSWWRLASETRQDIFPEQLGHYWVWRDESRDWTGLFRAEAAEWQAKLLDAEASGATPLATAQMTNSPTATAPESSRQQADSTRGSPSRHRHDPASAEPTLTTSAGSGNRAVIAGFISKMAEAGHQITKKDIWILAGYENPTEFERYQRGDKRTTRAATSNFNRILNMEPEDFFRALSKKKTRA